MADELKMIADRIRELRESCDYTVKQLADELGIAESVLADYETNGQNIPISVIYDIAHIFKVDFSEILTGNTARINTYCVVRKGEGIQVNRCPGYDFLSIAHKYNGKIMEPMIVTVEPDNGDMKLISHPGQEFNYVLSGTVKVIIGDKEIFLKEGDSIYFNPTYPHGQRAVEKTAKFLTIITDK